MHRILIFIIALILSTACFSQVSIPDFLTLPSPTLDESSGVVYSNGELWTHNDSGNPPAIYKLDTSNGEILQTVDLVNATNVDWEDITADDNFIYVGDFGNNSTGIRTNLRVYKIARADIPAGMNVQVEASVISFSYSDQVIGTSPGSNKTQFDCEALFVKDNILHLFTKDWVNGHTKHYTLSTIPGTYSISPVEPSFDAHGLITSAAISDDERVALVGYEKGIGNAFMYVFYNFSGGKFFNGNNRRIVLGKVVDRNVSNSMGQLEAVTFTAGGAGFVTNEKLFSVPARMMRFTLDDLETVEQ
jgi:hypothetical protein